MFVAGIGRMPQRWILPTLVVFVLFGAGCAMNVAANDQLLDDDDDDETETEPASELHENSDPPPCMTELRQTVGGRTLRILVPCARRRSWIRFPFYPVDSTRR